MVCLRRLVVMVERMLPVPKIMGLNELLGEAGQIIAEFTEENTRKK